MTKEKFGEQLIRLADTFSARAYPSERKKLIWHAVKHMGDGWMETTVNYLIGHYKSAPNVKDFREKVDEYEAREKERRLCGSGSDGSVAGIMHNAANYTKANPEYMAKQKEILTKKFQGKYTAEQFEQACDLLDQAADIYNPSGKERVKWKQ